VAWADASFCHSSHYLLTPPFSPSPDYADPSDAAAAAVVVVVAAAVAEGWVYSG